MSTAAARATTISVVLVDDHQLCQKGLAELLTHSGHFTVAGATGNPAQARAMVGDLDPDLVVLDLRMPLMDGASLVRQLRADGRDTPAVILTMSDGQEDLSNALRAGVRGYLLKDMEPGDIVEALRRVAKGEMVVAPSLSSKLASILQDGAPEAAPSKTVRLTEREREILRFIANGSSNKAIAKVLNISHDTVKLHVRHILAKLNLSTRVQAAVFAVEQRSGHGEPPPTL